MKHYSTTIKAPCFDGKLNTFFDVGREIEWELRRCEMEYERKCKEKNKYAKWYFQKMENQITNLRVMSGIFKLSCYYLGLKDLMEEYSAYQVERGVEDTVDIGTSYLLHEIAQTGYQLPLDEIMKEG